MSEVVHVFDMDDTLYLERDFVHSGFISVGEFAEKQFNVGGLGEYCWQLFQEGVRGSTFDRAEIYFQLPVGARSLLVEHYRLHQPQIQLVADALHYLQALKRAGLETGLITDGFGPTQWGKIEALKLRDLIDEIIVTSDHGSDWAKPSTKAFARLQARFGQNKSFVYYGDNPLKDFSGARALGWKTVRLRRPGGLHFEREDVVAADSTISAFDEELAIHDLRELS